MESLGMRNEIKAEYSPYRCISGCKEEHVEHGILKGQTIAKKTGNRCANKTHENSPAGLDGFKISSSCIGSGSTHPKSISRSMEQQQH